MTEAQFTSKICKGLEAMGAFVFAIVGGNMQRPGMPDRYVHHMRWQGFLEFKGEHGTVSQIQKYTINHLNKIVPGSAYIIRAPNIIEDISGDVVGHFDSANDLLLKLQEFT